MQSLLYDGIILSKKPSSKLDIGKIIQYLQKMSDKVTYGICG